jgi:RNA polymerase sigma factor (sigma-70 family)
MDMASRSLESAFQRLRIAVGQHDEVGLPDARLLADFINQRSEESFAFLVRRHARMVMGVCLRVARHRQDAEDAFQATFLVLVRKAAAIAQPEMLANWLYRVAHNTALQVNAQARKRRLREEPLTPMAEPAGKEPPHYLLAALDQELTRLPTKYRVPIILCDLEGKTQRKAAQLLGCPEKTLSSRLIRARDMLAKRLTRLGLAVSGGALLAALTQNAACASPTLISSTVKAAALLAGNAATGVVISSNVGVLMEGVIKAMFIQKLKLVGAVLLALGLAV